MDAGVPVLRSRPLEEVVSDFTGSEPSADMKVTEPERSVSASLLRLVAATLVLLISVVALYHPALGFELMGDDYQWWQHARRAMHSPALLVADLDTFYRPASTWSLVLNRLVTGDSPAAFHATNVLLHAVAGLLLVLAARRLGVPSAESFAVGLVWALSPFSEEPAVSVAIRFQDLLLLSWLGLVLAWPGPDVGWTRRRAAVVALLTVLAAASKETWVMTPVLAVALCVAIGRRRLRRCAMAAWPFVVAGLVYVAVYFTAFPGGKSYFSTDARVLWKLPHMLAAFLHLEQLHAAEFPAAWMGLLALSATIALAVLGWRRRLGGVIVGSAVLGASVVPTLLVPFLPTRYTAIPYAGLLLMIGAAVGAARRGLPPRTSRAVATAALAVAGLVLLNGVFTVRADLLDAQRVSTAHERLLKEAVRVAPEVPLDRPTAVVRGERRSPLGAISRSTAGLSKPFFVRRDDPYALIDAAALFEWTLRARDVGFDEVRPEDVRGRTGAVLIHRTGGFRWIDRRTGDVGRAAAHWRRGGLGLRVLQPVPLR